MVFPAVSKMLERLSPPTPAEAADGKIGEELGASDADLSVGRDESGFGLLDIRPAFEQLRRHARGHILRRRVNALGSVWAIGSGILAKQKAIAFSSC